MRSLLMLGLAVSAVLSAPHTGGAQSLPHQMKLDTPPVPGQIEQTRREKLRPGPSVEPRYEDVLGLPTSGPYATHPPRLDPVREELVQRRLDFNPLY
jgi:hypothetical protein